MKRMNLKNLFASFLALFLFVGSVLPQDVSAAQLYTVVRNINVHWMDANGNETKVQTVPQTAQISSPSYTFTFPAVSVTEIISSGLDQWTPNVDTIPAVQASYYNPPQAADLYMYPKNNQPAQPIEPEQPEPTQPDQPQEPGYTTSEVIVTRTVVYNFYDLQGQLVSTEQKAESVAFTVASTNDPNVTLPEFEREYTFPAIQVESREGYVSDITEIPAQKVEVGDDDIEVVVNYHADERGEPNEPSDNLEGWVEIICAGNQNFALDVNAGTARNNENIQIYQRNGGNNQKFYLKDAGDGYYYLLTGSTGAKSAVDVSGARTANKTNIIQYSLHGGDNQKWKVQNNGDGTFTFISKHSQKALDVAGANYGNLSNVLLWTNKGTINQKFVLVATSY